MLYIKKTEAFRKMKSAEESFRPVIILAHAGWGKTALVENYFKNRRVLFISAENGTLDTKPEINRIRQGVVVIDGVSWLDDPESEEYVRKLTTQNSIHVVLIGRGRFPEWLQVAALEKEFVQIGQEDLAFTSDDVFHMFKEKGVYLGGEKVTLLMDNTEGYPPALKICLRNHLRGESINRGSISKMKSELFHYFDDVFFRRIDGNARQLLMEVCGLTSFTSEMAEAITDTHRTNELIDYCEKVGSFLTRTRSGEHKIIEVVREFLSWKKSLLWSAEKRTDNNRIIANLLEKEGRLVEAANFFESAGEFDRIRDILISNSRMHPGVGQFHALRKHYDNLPDEHIIQEPALIAGVCLLNSMMMRPEDSERWYQELEQFERNRTNTKESRKEARALISYLDIGLPHRAGKGMIVAMRRAIKAMKETNFSLPEFSVTDNIPSVLNGGLDYSEWTRNADYIMRFMNPVFEKVLGKHCRGLTHVGLAEKAFECGNRDHNSIVRMANKGIAEATSAGSAEISLAGHGVLIRQNLSQGKVKSARDCLESYREKAERDGDLHLVPNIGALDAFIALYERDREKISRWLEGTPHVHREFSIMDRYIYMIKTQCLIANGDLTEAMNLAMYMDWYYTEYKRVLSKTENDILIAIIIHRQGRSDWDVVLTEALKTAERYHYVQVAAMKGSAVLPLLNELDTDEISKEFMKEVRERCREVSMKYPNFMKHDLKMIPYLTAREQEILGMLCSGESMEAICQNCGISYSGVKKHNRSIYGKLGAKNRAEAERIAAAIGLVGR